MAKHTVYVVPCCILLHVYTVRMLYFQDLYKNTESFFLNEQTESDCTAVLAFSPRAGMIESRNEVFGGFRFTCIATKICAQLTEH